MFFNGRIEKLSLEPSDFSDLIINLKENKLDFDDAYQLTVSQKYKMTIVTFDTDFNIDGIDKLSPEQVISFRDQK